MQNRLASLIGIAGVAVLVVSSPALSKTYTGRECRQDYKRLCPMTPIGKCDLESMMDKLSPRCKAFIEKNR
ncbi:hypothetical protein [Borborobacter arsenicus]|uniref:hypothetical protein n=1 Tax=Borborobacter arsenicus TaxID=1851146 RepID=UPI001AED0304|nr:hypothetical protein [Pseudaminobacter arsenicus]